MNTPRPFAGLLLAAFVAGLTSGCQSTPKQETKKEVEGVDYVLVRETGSLMPRKVRTKSDVTTSHTKQGDVDEFEKMSGEGARAPRDGRPR